MSLAPDIQAMAAGDEDEYRDLVAQYADGEPVDQAAIKTAMKTLGRGWAQFEKDIETYRRRREAINELDLIEDAKAQLPEASERLRKAGEALAAIRKEYDQKLRAADMEWTSAKGAEHALELETIREPGLRNAIAQTADVSLKARYQDAISKRAGAQSAAGAARAKAKAARAAAADAGAEADFNTLDRLESQAEAAEREAERLNAVAAAAEAEELRLRDASCDAKFFKLS